MITKENRIRLISESPVHGPIVLAELDDLIKALKMAEGQLAILESEDDEDYDETV